MNAFKLDKYKVLKVAALTISCVVALPSFAQKSQVNTNTVIQVSENVGGLDLDMFNEQLFAMKLKYFNDYTCSDCTDDTDDSTYG